MAAADKGRRKRTVAQQRAKNARSQERRAERAAETAKEAGAVGKRLPAEKAVLRDASIVSMAWAGWSTKRIAEEVQLSVPRIRQVLSDYRSMPTGMDQRPMEIVEELMRWYRNAVADFDRLAARYENVNAPAAIGAKRQARETMSDYVTLLASIGKLPTDLEVLAAEADLLRMGHVILEGVEQLARGEITVEQLAELARGVVLARGLPPGEVIEGRESEPKKRRRKRGGTPTAD